MRLILASGSPRRKELLTEAGYEFDVSIPDESVECGVCSNGGPAELVAELAFRKAADVANRRAANTTDELILAADTVAECDGHILGKPADEDDARRMLELMAGRTHRVYTGVCLWPPKAGDSSQSPVVQVDVTTLQMDTLESDELDSYLASNQWKGKAGAFGYQDRLGWVRIVQGSESNVVGLPMEMVAKMLKELSAA